MQLIFGFAWSSSLETKEEEYHHIYETALKPLIRELYQLPEFCFTFYFSGTILQWLARTHAEAIDVLEEMVKRKQVEMLGGSFYEPFITHVPAIDYMRQIELFSDNIRRLFIRRPQGFWLPAGIWHSQVVPLLAKSGISYTFLPASLINGTTHQSPYLPCVTEYDGRTLALFPLSTRWFQGFFPYHLEEHLQKMRQVNIKGGVGSIIVSLTSLKITKSGDLQRWLEILHARDSVSLTLPRKAYRGINQFTKVYPPSSGCKYLFTSSPVSHGDSLRALLKSFPESAKIYEKMYHTHSIIQQFRGDKARKNSARMNLWRGQSHFVYWSGFTTGIQSSSLRQIHYSALIEAEKTVRQKGSFLPSIAQLDYDFDGFPETLFYGNNINVYIHHIGASIFEFDWLHGNWNYGNSYTRKEDQLPPMQDTFPVFDRYPRYSFVDLCLAPGQSITDFAQLRYEESGNFRDRRYEVVQLDRQKKVVTFQCTAIMKDGTGITMRKCYRFLNNGFSVTYDISLAEERGLFHMDFCPDIALAFADTTQFCLSSKGKKISTDSLIEVPTCHELHITDLHTQGVITVAFSQAHNLWLVPIYAWGYYQGTLKKQYQFSSFAPVWPVRIERTQSFHGVIKVSIDRNTSSASLRKEQKDQGLLPE